MATPQTIVVGNTAAPQSSVGLQPPYPQLNNENCRRNKNTVRGLAITEIVLGSLCMSISIFIIAVPSYIDRSRYTYLSYHCIGEGLWCAVWVVIAGSLGVPTANKNVSRCVINCHLAFSIVGAVFAALMLALGVVGALIYRGLPLRIILYSFEALFALASMILCIISASHCCLLLGCCHQTMSPQSFGTQIYYQQQPQILGQGASGYQQGYVMQTQPNLQPMPATTSDLTYSFPTKQLTPNDENEQPGLAQKQAEAMDNPPSYPNIA